MVRTASRPVEAPVRTTHERRTGIALGTLAGTIGLGCCVYPVVIALVGASTATAAADLGNRMYSEWGWAFKGAAAVFAGTAIVVQRRRAKACPVDRRPDVKRISAWLVGSALATYGALYVGTKALEKLA